MDVRTKCVAVFCTLGLSSTFAHAEASGSLLLALANDRHHCAMRTQ